MTELVRKYVVMVEATPAPLDLSDPDAAFVLKPWKDPAALRALMAYRDNCYPELARDLAAWIAVIAEGPAIRGDVGRRNEPHLRPAARPARPKRRAAARHRPPASKRRRAAGHRKRRRRS
jgi:hypothetical protein